jgi:hypothetical protein
MGSMSKTKGKIGEREAAKEVARVLGVQCRRGVQYAGGPESPDLVSSLDGFLHFEVKRCEKLSVYRAMDQADRDKKETQMPVVLHRQNNRRWLAIVYLDDLAVLASKLGEV